MRITAKLGLANSIRKAAKTREDSWERCEPGEYKLSIHKACISTIPDKDEAELVNMLLFLYWDDSLEWADKVFARFKK